MNTDTLDALIDRLEKAAEGDWALDREIVIALGLPETSALRRSFTRSIDDALSLVPEGRYFTVSTRHSALRSRELADAFIWADLDACVGDCDSAPTPALALTIAALKARRAAP